MIIKRRKLQWYGHVSCSSGLAKTIVQCTVKGGRRQGRQRKRWEDNIREWTGLSCASTSGQWRTEKNGENWLQNHLLSSQLRDWWWWWWWIVAWNFLFSEMGKKRKAKKKKKKNQNMLENCPPSASKALWKKEKKKPFMWKYRFINSNKKTSLFSSHVFTLSRGYLFAIQLQFFFFSCGGRHGLVGLWPFRFFNFQELLQCFFLCLSVSLKNTHW